MSTTSAPTLSPTTIKALMMECLPESQEQDQDRIVVEGLVRKFAFLPDAIEKNKRVIYDLLMQLPETFRKSVGGGWSFLYATINKDMHSWGPQIVAEELMCLGIAAGLVRYGLPREFWGALAGGVPYFVFDDMALVD